MLRQRAASAGERNGFVWVLRVAALLLALDALAATADVRTGAAAYGDWRDDAPGVIRHFTVGSMPLPFQTTSAYRAPSVVPRPAGAMLHVPPGFEVQQFATGLDGPRTLRVAPNGDVFVAESYAGRVSIMRGTRRATFAAGMAYPFGIAFWPPGPQPRFVYIAETNRVIRFPYQVGDLQPNGQPEIVVPHLPVGGHVSRDIVFSPDGHTMFVSVGSASNIGTAGETERAGVLAFDPDGGNKRIYATGLRNCSAEAIAPQTGALWCAVNERDGLGDNLPPDYATSVRQGAFYGWPWYYIGDHEDPRLKGQRADLAGHVTVPDVLIQPHSAPLGITFYTGAQFPPEYRGDAFVALHGSWNRANRTGYKVIRLRFVNGKPTGEYEDFLTGFVVSDQAVWGRPVGVAVASDGSLLVSEDGNGTIWRITYREGNR
jgi:glucose/arabinose dehydrogenase